MARNLKQARDIEDIAAKRQEEIAAELFDYETVMVEVLKKAAEGNQHHRIMQDLKVTLKDTRQAQGLCKLLEDTGFTVSWVNAGQRVELVKDGSYELLEYEELVISWGAEAKSKYSGGVSVETV